MDADSLINLDSTLNPLLSQLLHRRGIASGEALKSFLTPSLREVIDPAELPDMAKAVKRLFQARSSEEPLVVFGDYDVDGITATALLAGSMRSLGWKVHTYLPHRMEDGYGINPESIANCFERFPVRLLLAVDSGSASAEAIDSLKKQSVETIVLDHHEIGSPAPTPFAFINPKSSAECPPSLRDLCSAGLAFKLLHALVKEGRDLNIDSFTQYDIRTQLDLVALGCIADLVPLTGENRILTSAGLNRLNTSARLGLKELAVTCELRTFINARTVAFQIAPRLNAAGRLGNATVSLDLLLTEDSIDAKRLAAELNCINSDRRTIESGIAEEASKIVRRDFPPEENPIIVVANEDWHIGVVGIVASRILKTFGRPAIVLGSHQGELRGSGRSVPGVDLLEAVQSCRQFLMRSGGHAMAVGLTLAPENLDAFRKAINERFRSQKPAELAMPIIEYDVQIALSELTVENVEGLKVLEPTGQGNPTPRVLLSRMTLKGSPRRAGNSGQHAFFTVVNGNASGSVVYWNCGEEELPSGEFDLLVEPEINDFRGQRTVQLKILDWRIAQ